MNSATEIAIVGDHHLRERLMAALPGFHFVEKARSDDLVAWLRDHRIRTLVALIDDKSRGAHWQALATESYRAGILALFWADSQERAFHALAKSYFQANVGVVSSASEVKPMLNLLWSRLSPATPKTVPRAVTMPEVAGNLDSHPFIQQTTSFLRSKPHGRLDVRKIAELYEEPLKRFADVLGVTPAAVSGTPDSKGYQARLGYFERVARIIPLLKARRDFAQWAKTPNRELKGRTPVEMLYGSAQEAQAIVEAVEDVLAGQPD